jgi:hypothetical protein
MQPDDNSKPFLHWHSLVHPAPEAYLTLPVPAPPTQSYQLGVDEVQEGPIDGAALASLIGKLKAVDVRHL